MHAVVPNIRLGIQLERFPVVVDVATQRVCASFFRVRGA